MSLISQAAIDLIVQEEVTSKSVYEKKYQRPEWPGGQSGVTIGIGYDVGAGVSSADQLRKDWRGRIPDHMIEALVPCIHKTGAAGHAALAGVKNKVNVPWDAAMSVFSEVDVPRWYKACVKAIGPKFEQLSPDCRGVILSLAYNRGAAHFNSASDRSREMHAIKLHVNSGEWSKIPGDIRGMKRLWAGSSVRGLVDRREREAKLFEKGLKAPHQDAPLPQPTPAPKERTTEQPGAKQKPSTPPATAPVIVTGTGAAGTAAATGHHWVAVAILVVLAAGAAYIAYRKWIKK